MNNYLQKKRILLVSSQTSHRSGMRKTLTDLGAENSLIEVAGNYGQAKERLGSGVVNIIITDDDIDKKLTGMDLLHAHIANNPVSNSRIFMLMTNTTTPFLLADFSLKGGDILLSKPFKNDVFTKTLAETFVLKEKKDPNGLLALQIRDAIDSKDLVKAKSLMPQFSEPTGFHALSCVAMLHEEEKELQLAYEMYLEAIKKKKDFRSLVALVRVGVQLKKHKDLLKFIEIWLKDFPLHHDSLNDITRVIIANKKFELLDAIFDLFIEHKVSDNFAKIPLAAGYILASSNHLEHGRRDKAVAYAHKGIEYSCRKMSILVRAIEILKKAGSVEEAQKAYLKLASTENSAPEDKVFDLMMKNIIYPKDKVLVECMKLLSSKIVNLDLYKITINCMQELGKDADDFIVKAKKTFPNEKF